MNFPLFKACECEDCKEPATTEVFFINIFYKEDHVLVCEKHSSIQNKLDIIQVNTFGPTFKRKE